MSQNRFYVSHNEEQLGPMTLEDIASKVKSSELNVMDYIYVEEKSDWVSFVEYEPLMQVMKSAKPASKPASDSSKHQVSMADVSSEKATEWFVLKGENKFGPFNYLEMVKMLQEKLVFEFDFIWKEGMDNWQRVAESEDFGADKITELKTDGNESIEQVFFRRHHKRASYNGTLLIHDNNQVWKGQALEISAGGAGVVMQNSMVVPGDILYLHFKPCEDVPPFNAICEVVSKQYVEDLQGKDTAIRYGMKFTSLKDADQKFLVEYTEKAKSA